MTSDLMTTPEAAAYLRVDPVLFSQWLTEARYSIPVVKVGPLPRFRKSHLDQWIRSRSVVRRAV